ncbi:hypothetical protein Bpfe_016812, partial [Biomphalaria pfeifferi]
VPQPSPKLPQDDGGWQLAEYEPGIVETTKRQSSVLDARPGSHPFYRNYTKKHIYTSRLYNMVKN